MAEKGPTNCRANNAKLLRNKLSGEHSNNVLNPVNYTATGELNHVSYNFTHLSGHGQGY